jgi:hypothetical protein
MTPTLGLRAHKILITKDRQQQLILIKSTESNLPANYDILFRCGSQIHYLLKEAHRWPLVLILLNFPPENVFNLPTLSSNLRACRSSVSPIRILHQSLQEYYHFNQSCYKSHLSRLPGLVGELWHVASLNAGYDVTQHSNYRN